jgi:hypothetical protein
MALLMRIVPITAGLLRMTPEKQRKENEWFYRQKFVVIRSIRIKESIHLYPARETDRPNRYSRKIPAERFGGDFHFKSADQYLMIRS